MNNHTDTLYHDKNLVQFYDYDNPWLESYDVLIKWIKSTDTVLDIGCGTGTLAAALITKCKTVYALDISEEMLAIAKEKTPSVQWIKASATAFSLQKKFDFIYLSGHSFQTLLNDQERLTLLKHIKNHLNVGGRFVFDSRNPLVEEWTSWGPKDSIRFFKHPQFGIIKSWNDWRAKNDLIIYETFYQVLHTNRQWKATSKIAFPNKEKIYSLIEKAGLHVKQLYGSWDLDPYTATSDEMIFIGDSPVENTIKG